MAEIKDNNYLVYKQININEKSFSAIAVAPNGLPGDSEIKINGMALNGNYDASFVEDFFIYQNNLYIILQRTILVVTNALNGNTQCDVSIEIKDYYSYEKPQMFSVNNKLFAHIGAKLWQRNPNEETISFKIGDCKPLVVADEWVCFSQNLQSLDNINSIIILNINKLELKTITVDNLGHAPFPIKIISKNRILVENRYPQSPNQQQFAEMELF